MKNYEDKILVVLPDDEIKVIIIPQSLQNYIERLEEDVKKLKEEQLHSLTNMYLNSQISQQNMCLRDYLNQNVITRREV